MSSNNNYNIWCQFKIMIILLQFKIDQRIKTSIFPWSGAGQRCWLTRLNLAVEPNATNPKCQFLILIQKSTIFSTKLQCVALNKNFDHISKHPPSAWGWDAKSLFSIHQTIT